MYTCDGIFKTNLNEFKEHSKIFKNLCEGLNPLTSNLIYNSDKKIKNNGLDMELFYKSNKINWMYSLLDTVGKYIQQG